MKLNVLVKDVMRKKVAKINLEDSIKKAATIMRRNKIGSVLVFGEKNIKGILTTRDIVYKYVARDKGKRAKDIMSKELITISPSKTLEEAARLMVEKGIEKLPVFDKNKLIGIITNNDILRVEPAMFEILLERTKLGPPQAKEAELEFSACEICGNYSDDVEEIDGVYKCRECRG